MAKRKRLTPPNPSQNLALEDPKAPLLETKSVNPLGLASQGRPPVAQVAGDTAAHAALAELAEEMEGARASGRMVRELAPYEIKRDHLLRDRMHVDADEMEALKASIRERGQQTPIEVVDLGDGVFGLISGWRRLRALKELHQETEEAKYATVLALVKPMESVADSYVAMVEENEIRADLSFYERARLASEAAKLGIYPTSMKAVRHLFASGSRARRSKINSFVRLYEAIGRDLTFPTHIPEKLGLALVKAIEEDARLAGRLTIALQKAAPKTADEERGVLENCLKGDQPPAPSVNKIEAVPGVTLQRKGQKLTLSGDGVTEALEEALLEWLREA